MDKTVNHPPVPVPQAIQMTTDWRDYYAAITHTEAGDAFRGFTIPLEDHKAMVDMAEKDQNITTVRAYLALGEPVNGGALEVGEVHILLVPVINTGGAGTDLPEVERGGVLVSTVQDFTKPCPALCDVTSPLYGPQISQD